MVSPLLPILHQHLASLSLTVTQELWQLNTLGHVYQLRRGPIQDLDHLREKEGKMKAMFSTCASSFPPVEAYRVFLKWGEQNSQLSS